MSAEPVTPIADRDALLSIVRRLRPKTHPIETPEGTLYVRELDGASRAALGDGKATHQRIAAYGLSTPDGVLLFDPTDDASVAELAGMEVRTLDAIVSKVMSLAGMTPAKVEAAEKKSVTNPNG
jgi:hypothetical protein